MKTSSFFSEKINNEMNLVSIAGLAPKEILEIYPNMKSYDSLKPPQNLVLDYKSGKITEKEYTRIYKEQLNNLDPFQVYNDLKDSILLCWEPPGRFCHRHLVSKWISTNVLVPVIEL